MNLHFFNPELYHTRRAALAVDIRDGLIVLPANDEVGMNYRDNAYPFRQDSSFLYYTGLDRPGLVLLIDSHTGESILMGDDATVSDIVWTGPVPTLHELAEKSGIDRVVTITQGLHWISELKSKQVKFHYLPIYRGDHAFALSKLLKLPVETVETGYSKTLASAVVHMREIKRAEEINEISDGIRISGDMHRAMMSYAKSGMTEAQVMSQVHAECLKNNVALPYPIILSINGQTLHNHSYNNTIQHGQLLLGDFGAESAMHYAGDITRTIPVSKEFNPLQKDIYSLVLTTLQHSIDMVKHGIPYKTIHLAAAKHIASGMIDLGFLSGQAEDIVDQGAHALFFPHGLGHPLGLDVHDMEGLGEEYSGYEGGLERSNQFGLRSLRLAKPLKSGMVITVEPGIYFIPELISLWKSEKKFTSFINYDKIEKVLPFGGIRIEDNVLVQADHGQILGPPIPKEIRDIESLRDKAYQ